MSSLDRTFCSSPNCKNECGRKLPADLKQRIPANSWISYAYFCDLKGKPLENKDKK